MDGGFNDDLLDGGDGTDLMIGNFGNDILISGGGTLDELFGSEDDDVLVGSAGGSGVLSCGLGANDFAFVGPSDAADVSCETIKSLSLLTISDAEPVGPSAGDYWLSLESRTLSLFDGATWNVVYTQ